MYAHALAHLVNNLHRLTPRHAALVRLWHGIAEARGLTAAQARAVVTVWERFTGEQGEYMDTKRVGRVFVNELGEIDADFDSGEDGGIWVSWHGDTIYLDGSFSLEELEFITAYVRENRTVAGTVPHSEE
jgi:hypothetical protein